MVNRVPVLFLNAEEIRVRTHLDVEAEAALIWARCRALSNLHHIFSNVLLVAVAGDVSDLIEFAQNSTSQEM